MCFYKRYNDKVQIAKKDIKVYKVTEYYKICEDELVSSYQYFHYKFNKIYKEHRFDGTSRGFHSYTKVNYFYIRNILEEIISIGASAKKFNIGWNRIDENNYNRGLILECTIPKGSKYIFNGTDYISDQIIINNIILPSDRMYKFLPSNFRQLIDKHYTVK